MSMKDGNVLTVSAVLQVKCQTCGVSPTFEALRTAMASSTQTLRCENCGRLNTVATVTSVVSLGQR